MLSPLALLSQLSHFIFLFLAHCGSPCNPLQTSGQIGTSLVKEVVGPTCPKRFSEGVQAKVGPAGRKTPETLRRALGSGRRDNQEAVTGREGRGE